MGDCGCKKKNCGELNPTCPTWEQIYDLLSTLQLSPLETTTQYGRGRLSFAALNRFDPINVSNNEPFVRSIRKAVYLEAYGQTQTGVTAAIAAIGSSTRTRLIVSANVALTATTTFTKNIFIQFEGDGAFSPSANTTTIRSMIDPGVRQVFFATSTGKVVLDTNATGGDIRLEWWAGVTPPASIDLPMTQALLSVANGGRIRVGVGTWIGSGNWELPKAAEFIGAGKSSSDISRGTIIQLVTGSSATCIFKVKVGFRDNAIRHCSLDCLDNAINPNCAAIEFYGQGTYGVDLYAGFRFVIENVLCYRGKYGIWIHDNASGGWQVAEVRYFGIEYQGQSAAAYRCECVNGNHYHLEPQGLANDNTIFFDCIHSGTAFTVAHADIAGVNDATHGQTCYKFTLSQIAVNIEENEDEAMQYGVIIQGSQVGYINLTNCLFQSLIKANVNELNVVNINGGLYYCNSITSVAGSSMRVTVGVPPILFSTDLHGTPVSPLKLCDFAGTGSVEIWRPSPQTDTLQSGVPSLEFLSSQYDGVTRPIRTIVYNTNDSETKIGIRLGRATSAGVPDLYYDFQRYHPNGHLQIIGNQIGPGYLGECALDVPNAVVSGNDFLPGVLTAASITGDTNNYFASSTGTDDNNILKGTFKLSSTGRFKVTGFDLETFDDLAPDGTRKLLVNTGSYPIDFTNEDTASVAGNRIKTQTGRTVTIWPNQSAWLNRIGNAATGRWYLWVDALADQDQTVYWPENYNYNNTSTLTSVVTHLDKPINVQAGCQYVCEMTIGSQCHSKSLQIDFNGGSAGWNYAEGIWSTNKASAQLDLTQISDPTTSYSNAANDIVDLVVKFRFDGVLSFSSSGTFAPRMAQRTAAADNTGVYVGSFIKLKMIGY